MAKIERIPIEQIERIKIDLIEKIKIKTIIGPNGKPLTLKKSD
jgi:hypothetical protein